MSIRGLIWLSILAFVGLFWFTLFAAIFGCSTQHILMGGKEYDCAIHSNGASSDLDCGDRKFKSVSNFTMVKDE